MKQSEKQEIVSERSDRESVIVDEDLSEIIEKSNMTDEEQKKVKAIIQRQFYSGPLPSPEMLKEYNKIPGATDVILEMARSEMKHRHENENKIIDSEVEVNRSQIQYIEMSMKIKNRLQVFGFIISILLVCFGCICLFLNRNMTAVTVFVGAICSFCGIMFYGKMFTKGNDSSVDKDSVEEKEDNEE